jgi:hypothetical protein
MSKKFLFVFLLFFLIFEAAFAIDFWQYPEAADKGSIFAGVYMASLSFSAPSIDGIDCSFFGPEFCLDYVLPIGLPFSLGVSFQPMTESFSFGLRPAYHINLDIEWLGLYLMLPMSATFSEKALTFHYGLGAGLRTCLKDFFFLSVEISPLVKGLVLGVSFRLN